MENYKITFLLLFIGFPCHMEIYVNTQMRKRPRSSGEFANDPPVLHTLAIVDALGDQRKRNEFWLQELSRDTASFLFFRHNTYCSPEEPSQPAPAAAVSDGCSAPSQSGSENQAAHVPLDVEQVFWQANSVYQILHVKSVNW